MDPQYCSRYCRSMLRLIENSDSDQLQDLLYDKVGELFSSTQSDDEVTAYRTYFLSSSQPGLGVSVRETRALISGGTTGLSTWTAGQCLAGWLDSRPHLISGKTVLELGAGAGLTGIFLLKRFSREIRQYTFTDSHSKVLDNLKHNLARNLEDWRIEEQEQEELQLENEEDKAVASVRLLDWETFSQSDDVEADLILGADIVFDPSLLTSLVRTLRSLLTRRRSEALLACCVRNEDTFALFESLVMEQGLSFVKESMRETECDSPVYLVKISPK